jgi:hypothetical protein
LCILQYHVSVYFIFRWWAYCCSSGRSFWHEILDLGIKHVSKSNKKAACSFVTSLRPETTGCEQTTGPTEENYILLGHYVASSGNSVQTFRDNISVPSSRGFSDSWPLKLGQICCPETSARNYHCSLRNDLEESSSLLPGGGSPISRELLDQFHLKSQFHLVVVSLGVGAVLREQLHGLSGNIYFY